MARLDIGSSSTTDLNNAITTFSVDPVIPDAAGNNKEFYYDFPDANKQLAYFKKIPEIRSAVMGLITWTLGKGYKVGLYDRIMLEHIHGWGEDSFQSILENLMMQKKVCGDAFAEIIRDPDTQTMINLKPLYTGDMRIVVNDKGLIVRYEQKANLARGLGVRKLKKEDVLHLCNDRFGNEVHGVSIVESAQWVIDALQEALEDERKIKHRELALGVLYVDTDNEAKQNIIKRKYQDAIQNGEMLVLPTGTAKLEDSGVSPKDRLSWIQFLTNKFYEIIGIPKVMVSSDGYSEASSKVGFMTFDPVYSREQQLLEDDLWHQLSLKITFNRPPSLMNTLAESEQKNTGQIGIQPNEVTASVGRTE
jgi:hypothetical protein